MLFERADFAGIFAVFARPPYAACVRHPFKHGDATLRFTRFSKIQTHPQRMASAASHVRPTRQIMLNTAAEP
jgi:hypothetical protein